MIPSAPGIRPLARAAAAAASLALLAGAPALAAPGAAEVWADIRDGLAAQGYELSVQDEQVGADAVRARGLVLTQETPGQAMDETGRTVASVTRVEMTLSEVELIRRPAGDDIAVRLPAEAPIRIVTTAEGLDTVTVAGLLRTEALDLSVAEAADGLRYVYAAESAALVFDEIEGGAGGELAIEARLEGLDGQTLTGAGEGARTGTQSQRADRLTFEITFEDEDPMGAGAFDVAFAMADIASTGRSLTPEGTDLSDPAAVVREDGALEGSLVYGPTRLEAALDGPGGNFDVTSTSDGGEMRVSLDGAGIGYALSTAGSRVSLRGGMLPVPELSYAIESSAIDVSFPLVADEAAQPFALAVALTRLALDDGLWSLLDPGAVLPRDPASLDLSVTGTAILPEDLIAPLPEGEDASEDADGDAGAEAEPGAGPEAESDARPDAGQEAGPDEGPDAAPAAPSLATIALERLSLDVAGARLNASGAFEAADEGEPAVPGLPPLAGTLEVDLTGAEALLDGLVAMGVLPQEQAAFVRGMLGFVARPTGADAYATEIELGADGSVTAGGMALR